MLARMHTHTHTHIMLNVTVHMLLGVPIATNFRCWWQQPALRICHAHHSLMKLRFSSAPSGPYA